MSFYTRKEFNPQKLLDQTINGQPWRQKSQVTNELNSPNEVQSNVDQIEEIPSSTKNSNNIFSTIRSRWWQILAGVLIAAAFVGTIAGPVVNAAVNNGNQSTTSTTVIRTTITTSTTSSASTSTTSSTSTSTTTTAAPSSFCISSSPGSWANNFFLYSNLRTYAFGLYNYQLGVYKANSTVNVTSTSVWTASQSSTTSCSLALQTDRNLVIYGTAGGVFWTNGVNNGGIGRPFCLLMWDSGNVQWIDNSSTTVWQTNSAQSG